MRYKENVGICVGFAEFFDPLYFMYSRCCVPVHYFSVTGFSGAPLLPQLSLNLKRNPKGCSINYGIRNVQKKVLTFWSLFVS